MRISIVDDFKHYQMLMLSLETACFKYHQLLAQRKVCLFNERVLKEDFSDKREQLEHSINELKEKISALIERIDYHIESMNMHLKNESVALQKSEVNEINSDHVDAMRSYDYCTSRMTTLKKQYKDWDSSEVSFVELDRKKMLLNIAIKEYNDKNLRLMNYKLLDVFEALKVVKEQP